MWLKVRPDVDKFEKFSRRYNRQKSVMTEHGAVVSFVEKEGVRSGGPEWTASPQICVVTVGIFSTDTGPVLALCAGDRCIMSNGLWDACDD